MEAGATLLSPGSLPGIVRDVQTHGCRMAELLRDLEGFNEATAGAAPTVVSYLTAHLRASDSQLRHLVGELERHCAR
jgi:hypothetical protein